MSFIPNTLMWGVGPALASAATITPTYSIHHVTGIVGISTITNPAGIQPGERLVLIFDGLCTLLTGGNINKAVTIGVVGDKVILYWDGSKWC